MKLAGLVAALLAAGLCAPPVPFTANVEQVASRDVKAGSAAQLVVKVTNTGPVIPHLDLVFRTADRWFERHKLTDLARCAISTEQYAISGGDLVQGESKAYS